jgi:hypothetical protein
MFLLALVKEPVLLTPVTGLGWQFALKVTTTHLQSSRIRVPQLE